MVYSWYIYNSSAYQDETKTSTKFNVFSFSKYEVKSYYFVIKFSKSEDNIQKHAHDYSL